MLKEKLEGILGGVGIILWYIISASFTVLPIVAINGPWWLSMLLIFAVLIVPLPIDIPLWIWGLVCVLKTNPTSVFAIIYYVAMAIVVTFQIIDFAIKVKEG